MVDKADTKLDKTVSERMAPDLSAFKTVDEAGKAVLSALPGISCPVCRHDRFSIADNFDQDVRTQISMFHRNFAIPTRAITTLSLVCENCGFVCTFVEPTLKKLAETIAKDRNG